MRITFVRCFVVFMISMFMDSLDILSLSMIFVEGQLSHCPLDKMAAIFEDDIFNCIFLTENILISIKFSLKFIPKLQINNIPEIVQIMAWCRPSDKLLSEKMMVSLLTHMCGLSELYCIPNKMQKVAESITIFYSTVCSGADQRKHQSSASLAFLRGIHWWLVNSPHKWPVTLKMFPFDDVIM